MRGLVSCRRDYRCDLVTLSIVSTPAAVLQAAAGEAQELQQVTPLIVAAPFSCVAQCLARQ